MSKHAFKMDEEIFDQESFDEDDESHMEVARDKMANIVRPSDNLLCHLLREPTIGFFCRIII